MGRGEAVDAPGRSDRVIPGEEEEESVVFPPIRIWEEEGRVKVPKEVEAESVGVAVREEESVFVVVEGLTAEESVGDRVGEAIDAVGREVVLLERREATSVRDGRDGLGDE